MFSANQIQLLSTRTSYQLWGMGLEMSWSGAVLLQQGLSSSTSLNPPWIIYCTRGCLRKIWDHLSKKLKLKGMWTMQHDNDPNITVNAPGNGSKERSAEFWNCQVKARILILLRECGVIWNGSCMQDPPPTSHSRKNSTWRSGIKFLLTDVRNWCYMKRLSEVISAKGGKTSN